MADQDTDRNPVPHTGLLTGLAAAAALLLAGCSGSSPAPVALVAASPTGAGETATLASPEATTASAVPTSSSSRRAGTPSRSTASAATSAASTAGSAAVPGTGRVAVPADGTPVNTSKPTRVIGTGTPASCTSAAVVSAVAAGGVVTFDCGPNPVTIRMTATAKVRNANPKLVLDGGGTVTLSGGGARRILYQNTCDAAQGWTTDHCQNQASPTLVVQNLTFADGDSTGQTAEGGGGGAIFVRGGRLKVINSRFVGNRCEASGPDVGGAAVRVLSQYQGRPVVVSNSTFSGGSCANGGALSSIGVSWTIVNSTFRKNVATGRGAGLAGSGTPGGGSGGAIYLDGNTFSLDLRGSLIEDNTAPEGGGAIFFVSNDRTGTATLTDSTLRRNASLGFETKGLPGIFFQGARPPTLTRTTLSR